MRILGKHRADFAGLHVRKNQSNSGTLAELDLEIGVDEDSCAKEWGESFRQLVFGTLQESTDEETGEVTFTSLVDAIKPGKRAVYEHHDVEVEGITTRCQPEIQRVTLVAGKASAVVKVRLSLELSEAAKIIEHLREKPGALLAVEFNPSQMGLKFGEAA